MFSLPRFALVAAFVAIAAFVVAADPPPLLPPLKGQASMPRVRLPMDKDDPSMFAARITDPKAKKATTAVKLEASTLVYEVKVSIQQWKAWGFTVPANRIDKLPEVIIPAAQVAPKLAKGQDVEYRLKDIKVMLYEAPGGAKGGVGNVLQIPFDLLTAGTAEPRIYFADRFLELGAPAARVKALDAGDAAPAALKVTDDKKLLPVVAALNRNAFAFVSVNGQTQYFLGTGKLEPVVAVLDLDAGAPITITADIARGCGVNIAKGQGKVAELRFGSITGASIKGQRDLVLKNVTVDVSDDVDAHVIWLSAAFVEEYFKDGICVCKGTAWKLHGRVPGDLLEEVKTRKPVVPKKP